jgi:hypothetical protein
MAKGTKPAGKPQNRRGSPEAIEKRRAARIFNDVVGGRGVGGPKLDGRTEKRRQRLLRELEAGTARSKELKPLDVLQHVHELMELGEPLSSIRKVAKVRKPANVSAESMVEVVSKLHQAYNFRPEAYRFVGVGDDVLRSAGVLTAETGRRGRAKKRAT